MKFLNDQDAFNEIYKYAQEAHPDLYEKSMPTTMEEEIEAIIKMSMGSLEDIVIDKTKTEDMAVINQFFDGWADNVSPERMEGVMEDYLPKAANLGGNRALADLGIKIAFNLKNPGIMKEIQNRGVKITGGISQTTLNNFRDTFYRGYMKKGMSPYDLKKQIKGMFEETYKNRAMTIARTETGVAQMTVQQETYVRNGIQKKRWLSLVDDRTRPSHIVADGQTRKIDEPFDVGGAAMMHPLDGYAPAREVINCRCDYTAWQVKSDLMPAIPWVGGSEVAAVMETGEIEKIELRKGSESGAYSSWTVGFKDKVKGKKISGIAKISEGSAKYGHEVGAGIVDRELGNNLVPTTVKRKMDVGTGLGQKNHSIQMLVDDATPAGKLMDDVYLKEAGKRLDDNAFLEGANFTTKEQYMVKAIKVQDLDDMAAFDYIVGNSDRHANNWMLTPKKKVVAIDHGLAFNHFEAINSDFITVMTDNDRPITGRIKKKVEKIIARKEIITKELTGLVDEKDIQKMWKRADQMIKYDDWKALKKGFYIE